MRSFLISVKSGSHFKLDLAVRKVSWRAATRQFFVFMQCVISSSFPRIQLQLNRRILIALSVGAEACAVQSLEVQMWRRLFGSSWAQPESNFFGKTPLFFRYSGGNAANAVNLQSKRR